MKAGIPADMPALRAGTHSSRVFMTVSIASAEHVGRAVLAQLAARMPAAELEDAKAATPRDLHNLWPN